MLDAAGATHVSQSLRHWGAPLSPWPDIADEMIHPSFTDITERLVSIYRAGPESTICSEGMSKPLSLEQVTVLLSLR